MAKSANIVTLLSRRIQHGDYALKALPSELKLSAEFDVSRFTIRKALNELLDQGVLLRLPNGRLAVNRQRENGLSGLQIAFLQPSHPSYDAEWYRLAAERAAGQRGATLRPILYLHWHDSLIQDALDGFDGVFFMPFPEQIPDWLVDAFRGRPSGHVVVLDQDLSKHGVQSVQLFPASFVQRLLDHLAELGHRRICCFNVHPLEPNIRARIEQWQIWCSSHGIRGVEYDEAGKHTGWLSDQAYKAMEGLLNDRADLGTALLCTTMPGAIGVMRAMKDYGLQVGRDISLSAINDDGVARYLSPSITALALPDPAPFLGMCIDKMMDGEEGWRCPLLLQLDKAPLFVGESTGPPIPAANSRVGKAQAGKV